MGHHLAPSADHFLRTPLTTIWNIAGTFFAEIAMISDRPSILYLEILRLSFNSEVQEQPAVASNAHQSTVGAVL